MPATSEQQVKKRDSRADRAFDYIGNLIVDGHLRPGDRIRDYAYAEILGLSRTPVREALQRLEHLGMVAMRPSRFTVITQLTTEDIDQTVECVGYEAAIVARLATSRMSDGQRAHAGELIGRLAIVIGDPAERVDALWAIVKYFAGHSGNDQQKGIVEGSALVWLRALRQSSFTVEHTERAKMSCADLRLAVVGGDAARAEGLVREIYGII